MAKRKRCDHSNGWYTDHAMIWYDAKGGVHIKNDLMTFRNDGKVRVGCNVQGCGHARNLYFKGGRFVKVGRPFVPEG